MSGISIHVLDVTLGRPAAGLAVRLEREERGVWRELSQAHTDPDGRIRSLLSPDESIAPGRYRLGFETGTYFHAQGLNCFHPYIQIAFDVTDANQNYHVPLLIAPYSYSTYRGT